MDELEANILLNMTPEIGPARARNLRKHFHEVKKVFSASLRELCAVEGIDETLANKITSEPKRFDLERELNLIAKHNVQIMTLDNPNYPRSLKALSDPPAVIYFKGNLKQEDNIAVAIVGTRKPTLYGKTAAEKFSSRLAELKITIISGLARGIDTQAHLGAISSGGRTIAVLGNGLDVHYPPENRKLEEKIASCGALISEFPMTTPPEKGNFPRRNRLIAGLSSGVLVIEADLKSGALITARLALEQGREVFALPGSIFSKYSRGPHYLIQEGAKLVTEIEDIIEEIQPLKEQLLLPLEKRIKSVPELTEEEKKLYTFFPGEPVSIDFLIGHGQTSQVALSLGKISQLLLSLEMKGLIKQMAGKMYQKSYEGNI